MGDKKCDVRLHVHVDDSIGNRYGGSQYANLNAELVVLAADSRGKTDAWAPDSYQVTVPEKVRDMSGFKFSAQLDDTTVKVPGREWYGVHTGFETSRIIDLAEATRMHRVLGPVQRRLDKFEREMGHPRDAVDLLIRVALIVTDTPLPFLRQVGAEDDWERTGYRSMSADDLRYWLDGQVKAWRDKHGITVPE